MMDAWDRAVSAEKRRCKRMGFIYSQPACDWRQDDYSVSDLVELGNCNGAIAAYRVGPAGRITRMCDGSLPEAKDYVRRRATKQVAGYGIDGSPIMEPVTIETSMEEDIIDYGSDGPASYSARVLRHLTDAVQALRMVTTTMTPAERSVFEVRWVDALEGVGVLKRIAIMADAIGLALAPSPDRQAERGAGPAGPRGTQAVVPVQGRIGRVTE